MTLGARDLRQALKRHGFVKRQRGKHEIYVLTHKGKNTRVSTAVSHGNTELRNTLCGKVRRDLFLESGADLKAFVDGSLSTEEYVSSLIDRRIIG